MSTLTVTNINTGSNSTTLTIATGGTYGGSIKLEAANSNMIISGNVNMANAAVNGVQVSGFMGGYKNKIINANFDIWQRGTSNGMSGYFTADRWNCTNTGTTKTASRQSFTLGQTDVPGEPTYFMRHVVTSSAGASNLCAMFQRIESVRTLAGKTVTLSFYAKADTSKNIAIEFDQSFGTGGSPSSIVQGVGVTTCALTSSWQKFTVTTAMPSISGKTLGSNNDDFLRVIFWFDAGSSFNSRTNSLGQQSGTFDIAQVQLEEGPVATEFEQRHIGQELELCQRYYQKYSGGPLFRHLNYATTTQLIYCSGFWPVTLRASPTFAATGDLSDGASFTTWDTLFADSNVFYLVKSGTTLQFLDVNLLTADAEL